MLQSAIRTTCRYSRYIIAPLFFIFSTFNATAQLETGPSATSGIHCEPTNAGPDKTICPGTPTVKIGTTDLPGVSYEWTPATGLSSPFSGTTLASPTVPTIYTLKTKGQNIINNGDFEQGDVSIGSDYLSQPTTFFTGIHPGTYTIITNPSNTYSNGIYCNVGDHTSGSGNMMLVDGGLHQTSGPGLNFWSQQVDVEGSLNYEFSVWFHSATNLNSGIHIPLIEVYADGALQKQFSVPFSTCDGSGWVNMKIPLITSSGQTSMLIEMKDATNSGTAAFTIPDGNDFAVDDISMRCLGTDDVYVNVVNECPVEVWPKVYYGNGLLTLVHDNSGNLFSFVYGSGDLSQSINHIGVLPTPPYINYTFQYNNLGVTNWIKNDLAPLFALSSGDVQLGAYNSSGTVIATSYYNGTSGILVAPPSLIPANETIIAETTNGGFITKNSNTVFYHSTLGSSSINITAVSSRFNPNTNKLFIYDDYNSLKIYQLTGSTFSLIASSPNYMTFILGQIDNQDNVYVSLGSILELYDCTTNTFNPITISGFPISGLPLITSNPYTENKFLIYNYAESKLYLIDLSSQMIKKIDVSGNIDYEDFHYLINGNDIFVSSKSETGSIGNQIIPTLTILPEFINPMFITKLDISNDFSFKQLVATVNSNKNPSQIIKLLIAPNPTTNTINLNIQNNNKQSLETYSITITNKMGRVVLQSRNSSASYKLNTTGWEQGVYYVEAINAKGERVSTSFIKL